jgi:hypothetical protein
VEDAWKQSLIPLYIPRDHDRKYDEAEYRADRERQIERHNEKGERAEKR